MNKENMIHQTASEYLSLRHIYLNVYVYRGLYGSLKWKHCQRFHKQKNKIPKGTERSKRQLT